MDLLDDEPSLQEALRHLTDWDADMAGLFRLDTAQSPPSHTPSQTEETKILEQERIEFLDKTTARAAIEDGTNGVLCREWEEIGARQRAQRAAVEAENKKLRKMLEKEKKTALRVSALVRKVEVISTALGTSPEACVLAYKGPQLDPQVHVQRLYDLAREAPVVFSSGCFADHAGREFRDVSCENYGREGPRIELSVSWVLPFDIESVVDALWLHTTRVPRKERATCFKDIYSAERTLVSKFVSEAKVLGTIDAGAELPVKGPSHGQIATLRADRTTDGSVLLTSNMEVTNFNEDGSVRSLMQANGFLRVEPLDGQNKAPVCRVLSCRRITSSAPGDSAEALAEYSKWAHVLTSRVMREQWWSSIEQDLQEIENTLCEKARSREPLGA